MRSKPFVSMLAMVALGSAAIASPPPAGNSPAAGVKSPAPELRRTRALLDRLVAENWIPGYAAAIGRGSSPPMFLSGGRIDLDEKAAKARPDSMWRIYSMTKPLTAAAVMLLVEDGRVGLDEDVAHFIPSFRRPTVAIDPVNGLRSRSANGPVTIRMLLTHTAGLSYAFVAGGALQKEYRRLGLLPYAFSPGFDAQDRTIRPNSLAEFAERAGRAPLMFDPGTQWSYSIGLDVAARVVEVASGMPFERFLSNRILDPLGMRDTAFSVPAGKVDRLAAAPLYVFDRFTTLDPAGAGSVFARPPQFAFGGAGLVSSARDYDRFLAMLMGLGTLDGVRIMKPATARLMMSNLMPAAAMASGRHKAGAMTSFGAGGSVRQADSNGGQGAGTYMWAGAAGTAAWADRRRNIRVTLMINFFPSNLVPIYDPLVKAVYADVKGPAATLPHQGLRNSRRATSSISRP